MRKIVFFCQRNKIRVILTQLANTQLLSQSEKSNLLKQFQASDKNQEGTLSKDEIISCYDKILNDKFKTQFLVDKVFSELDTHNQGKIDY